MKTIFNTIIPVKGFSAINLFGVLFVRKEYKDKLKDYVYNHEAIHTAQMKELGYVLFYIIYVLEWVVRLFMKGDAYRNISFEKEAYINQHDLNYLGTRKHYAQWRVKNIKK